VAIDLGIVRYAPELQNGILFSNKSSKHRCKPFDPNRNEAGRLLVLSAFLQTNLCRRTHAGAD
jgi:hypothetical protein